MEGDPVKGIQEVLPAASHKLHCSSLESFESFSIARIGRATAAGWCC